jgi:hypothetical protein
MENYFEFEGVTDELFLDRKNENYSGFALDPVTAGLEAIGKSTEAIGKVAELGGKIAEASAKKKEAQAKIAEIAGQRQAQLDACQKAKENNFRLDPKKTKNKIRDCKDAVNKRFDADEKEQKEVVRRMTAIEEGKLSASIDEKSKTIEEKKASKKLYVIGGIVALVLILGTVVYLKRRG